jgi:hypothetical protein
VPEEIDRRLAEIETALASFNDRPVAYDPAEITFAGTFVSVDREGTLRIERGYVRPEDEPKTDAIEANGQEGAEPGRRAVRAKRRRPARRHHSRRRRRGWKPRKTTASSRCRNGSSLN